MFDTLGLNETQIQELDFRLYDLTFCIALNYLFYHNSIQLVDRELYYFDIY